MLSGGCLHTSNAKEKTELFSLQYFLPLQMEEALPLGLAAFNAVREQ